MVIAQGWCEKLCLTLDTRRSSEDGKDHGGQYERDGRLTKVQVGNSDILCAPVCTCVPLCCHYTDAHRGTQTYTEYLNFIIED